MTNIYETIRREVTSTRENRTALQDGRHAVPYSDLFQRVDRAAAGLVDLGVGPYSRIALFCGDSIDYVIASLAVLSLQAVVIPVPPSSAEHETNEVLTRIGADFLLFDKALCARCGDGFSDSIFLEKEMRLSNLDAGELPDALQELNPAFIRFSSGTTGRSKGVLLSNEAIHERTDAADKELMITATDTILWVLSMSYHFVVSILLFLRRGATIRLCYDDFPLALHDSVSRGEGTFIYAAPFHYYTLATSSVFAADSLQNIRMAISTAMKLQEDVAQAFAAKFGFELAEAYGIIEVGLPFINRSPRAAPGSVGRLLPDYELKLEPVGREGLGEIKIRGKGMFDAYVSPWQRREKDAWFSTGDLGRIDETGNLYLVGRKKGLINFMGMKIFPEEVEAVLDAHADVAESLVFGRSHPRYGQVPCAKVVRRGEVGEDALRAHCLRELSPHKTPKHFEFVECLPRTPSGKLRRSPDGD